MKKIIFLSLIFLLVFASGNLFGDDTKIMGNLVIIGGGLMPDNQVIYEKYLDLAESFRNRERSEIVIGIIPAGNESPISSAESYISDFTGYGVSEENIIILPLAVKDDRSTDEDESLWKNNGKSQEVAEMVGLCDAIWYVGGDQMRYTQILLDEEGKPTTVLNAIWEVYKQGAVLGGSSAGAAVMCGPMLAGGTGYGALWQGVTYEDNYGIEGDNRVFITDGLKSEEGYGFFTGGIVDQHFSQRSRLGRLIVACYETGINLGFGVDEGTALVVYNSERAVEAIGEGIVTIIDISEADSDFVEEVFSNARISIIEKGDRFYWETGEYELINVRDETIGYEYYDPDPVHTEMNSSLKDILTLKLLDNTAEKAYCFNFDWDEERVGKGILFIFTEDERSKGYWGKINGKETYAVLNVRMDFMTYTFEMGF